MTEEKPFVRLAVLGTGILGSAMARTLLAAGFPLVVYNRTRRKAEALAARGARIADTPARAIQEADVSLIVLTDGPAVDQVLFQSRPKPRFKGKLIIQNSTILPEESRQFARRIQQAGGSYLEAPVLGSVPEARERRLIVMAAGPEEVFQRARPILETLGPDPVHLVEYGKAAALKLALNQLIASLTASFSLSLGMVLRSGIPVDSFMNVLRRSALYAPTFDKKLPRYLEHNFENPNFPTRHLLKDVNLILTEAEHLGLNTTVLNAIKSVIEQTLRLGWVNTDYSSIFNAIVPDQ